MALPADVTEPVETPTAEWDAFDIAKVAFKLGLLVDHWVKSSSTISVSPPRYDRVGFFWQNAIWLIGNGNRKYNSG